MYTGLIGFLLFVTVMTILVWRIIQLPVLRGENGIAAIFSGGTFAVLLFPIIVTQSVFSNWPGMLFWYSLSLAVTLSRIATAVKESA